MKKTILYTLLATLLTSCASTTNIKSKLNVTETEKLLEQGKNTIKGSALIRQQAGGIVTCAGMKVTLLPATDYSTERMASIYGNSEQGYNSAGLYGKRINFENTPPEYYQLTKNTQCDAQGFFKFENIANGAFFIHTTITWKVNDYLNEGGSIMKRVAVSNGEVKEVVLAP
ncbi:hypothetical protein [Iodobacter fluviatilis]|uniref:Lipoprotein n=1 Tax=Iodobacter fluviatilis TaxID=537 RepID=A0A7G3GB89_9NEIS|nr:hypothetical protein [Iodobacter fluviatilis]QBC44438.1 hypothetical protein C1H71_13465 [Iodobacter fluviatilis]